MHRRALLLAVCLFVFSTAVLAAPEGAAQNQAQTAAQGLADACAKVACRKNIRTVRLRADKGNVAEMRTQLYPYLDAQGEVIIYPDETITLAMPPGQNGAPRLLKVVEPDGEVDLGKVEPSDSTLSFSFPQMDGRSDMMLTIITTTAATIKYDAIMLVPAAGGMRPSHTSTCPVFPPRAGAKSFSVLEHWPYPITMLVLSNLHALANGAPTACT